MNKIGLNLKYLSRLALFMLLAWFAAYGISMGITTVLLIRYDVISRAEGGFMYRIWSVVFIVFAITLRFRSDFDFLLSMSNGRSGIFASFAVFDVILSLVAAMLIGGEALIVDALNARMGFANLTDLFNSFAPYGGGSFPVLFLFFFSAALFTALSGLLLGSLFYRFGKFLTTAFWICITGVLPILLLYGISVLHRRGELAEMSGHIKRIFRTFDPVPLSLALLLLSALWAGAAYLNIRRLPQRKA